MIELPRLVGMVHLGALPGAHGFRGDFEEVIARAVSDAETLAGAGFDGIMVENFGDVPFFADDVPKVTIAAMALAVGTVRSAVTLPIGVNVLRNDAVGALAVAAATGAGFVRVNVLSGMMYTDQGPIVGRAAEVSRARSALGSEVAILADVFVKHATPPPGLAIGQAARDLAERGGADAVIVSGTGTGAPAAPDDLVAVAAEVDIPLYVGSGVTAETVADSLRSAFGVIVGTSIKRDRDARNKVDATLAGELVSAAR